MTTLRPDPALDPGMLSLIGCSAGHPLAVQALRDLKRDAERYRWLRNQVNHAGFIPIAQCVWKRHSDPHQEWVNLVNGENLDSAIDEAMRADKA